MPLSSPSWEQSDTGTVTTSHVTSADGTRGTRSYESGGTNCCGESDTGTTESRHVGEPRGRKEDPVKKLHVVSLLHLGICAARRGGVTPSPLLPLHRGRPQV